MMTKARTVMSAAEGNECMPALKRVLRDAHAARLCLDAVVPLCETVPVTGQKFLPILKYIRVWCLHQSSMNNFAVLAKKKNALNTVYVPPRSHPLSQVESAPYSVL